MDFQTVIVAVILLGALLFVGKSVWRKTKSFSVKNKCASDCGCEGKKTS